MQIKEWSYSKSQDKIGDLQRSLLNSVFWNTSHVPTPVSIHPNTSYLLKIKNLKKKKYAS